MTKFVENEKVAVMYKRSMHAGTIKSYFIKELEEGPDQVWYNVEIEYPAHSGKKETVQLHDAAVFKMPGANR